MKCPYCGAAELIHDTRDVPYTYKGENTTIPAVSGDFCPACDEVVLSREHGDRYNEMIGLFQRQVNAVFVDPNYIAKVRRKLDLDQRQSIESAPPLEAELPLALLREAGVPLWAFYWPTDIPEPLLPTQAAPLLQALTRSFITKIVRYGRFDFREIEEIGMPLELYFTMVSGVLLIELHSRCCEIHPCSHMGR